MTTSNFKTIRESEKAVMINASYTVEFASSSAYCSSMVNERDGVMNIWLPKSQINENGEISEWIANAKREEIGQKIAGWQYVVDVNVTFIDAEGKEIKVTENPIKSSAKFEEGCKRHDALVEKAKAAGIKGVRKTLKSATLINMLQAAGVAY
jgi:hypothetical protein